MKKELTCLLISSALLLASCNEKASEIVVLVDSNHTGTASSGDNILFDIHAFANEGVVKRIQISGFDTRNGIVQLLDSSVDAKDFRFDFIYTVPQYRDTTDLQLSFKATNTGGNTAKATQRLTINADNPVLETLDAFTLFSAHSGKPDAFMVDLGQTVYLETSSDSCVDLYDMAGPAPDTLLREWRSGTGLSFARFNDFNFESATKQHVSNAYAVASKHDKITGICNNDIILLGRRDTAWGGIKVLGVHDEAGMENDRYIFALKKLKRRGTENHKGESSENKDF